MTQPRDEYVDWAITRALNQNSKVSAVSCFLSDIGKHPETAWTKEPGSSIVLLRHLETAYDRGEEAFREAMSGFKGS